MPSSDSEDFESADEGHTVEKKDRKKRSSSSDYCDDALRKDPEVKEITIKTSSSATKASEVSVSCNFKPKYEIVLCL